VRRSLPAAVRDLDQQINKIKGAIEQAEKEEKLTREQLDRAKQDEQDENSTHTILMGMSNYVLKNDPILLMKNVITGILRDIFGDSIVEFEIDTIEKRNQLETYFYVSTRCKTEEGWSITRQPVIASSGVGLIEVAFFLIRLLFLINHPSKPRKLLFADEPVSHLCVQYRKRFIEIVRELAKEFDVQIVMTTHEDQYTECADQVITVENNEGVSEIRQ